MLNCIKSTLKLKVRFLHLVSFQKTFTFIALAVIRLSGAAIQPHSTARKIETQRGYIVFKDNKLKRDETGCWEMVSHDVDNTYGARYSHSLRMVPLK